LTQTYWEFNVDSSEISGLKRSGSQWTGITDSGTSIIGLPSDPFNDVATATNAQFNFDFGLYEVDCGIKFQWTVTVSGNKLSVDESTALISINDVCLLAFDPIDYPGIDFILGNPFTRDYCQVFDLTGQIGLTKVTAN